MDKRSRSVVSPLKESNKRVKVSQSPKKDSSISDTADLLDDLCFSEEDLNFLIVSRLLLSQQAVE